MRNTSGLFQSLGDIELVVAASVRVAVASPVGTDHGGMEKLDADRIGREEGLPRLTSAGGDVHSFDRDRRTRAAARDVEETSVCTPLSRLIVSPE
jgi:hypothetical protein